MNDIGLSKDSFEEKILSLNNDLCRVIFNSERKCVFLVNNDIEKWNRIAQDVGLDKYNLTNSTILGKIKNGEVNNLSEIKLKTKYKDEVNDYVLKGESLERFDQFKDILRNTVNVEMYRRKINTYDIEVISPNIVEISNFSDDINLRRSLSKLVMRG